jgi:hypothetical protein
MTATFLFGVWVLLAAAAGPAQADPGRSGIALAHAQARLDAGPPGHATGRPSDDADEAASTSPATNPDAGSLAAPSEEDDPPPEGRPPTATPPTAPLTSGPDAGQPAGGPGAVEAGEASTSGAAPGDDPEHPAPAPLVVVDGETPLLQPAADPALTPPDGATPPLLEASAVAANLVATQVDIDPCSPERKGAAIGPGSTPSQGGRDSAAGSSGTVDVGSSSGATLSSEPLAPAPSPGLPLPLSLPVPLPAPAPSGPATSCAAAASGTSASGSDHAGHRDATLAYLDAGLAASLAATSARSASAVAGDAGGGTGDPGARPD